MLFAYAETIYLMDELYMIRKEVVYPFQMKRQHISPNAKGKSKEDIPKILKDVGPLPMCTNIWYRVTNCSIWYQMTKWLNELSYEDKSILRGRFLGGTVQYIPMDDLPLYYNAVKKKNKYDARSWKVFDIIKKKGPISKEEIIAETKLRRYEVDRAIRKLDVSHKIIRAGSFKKGWGEYQWDILERYVPDRIVIDGVNTLDARTEICLKFLSSNGPLTISELVALSRGTFTETEAKCILKHLEDKEEVIEEHFVGQKQPRFIRKEDYKTLTDPMLKYTGESYEVLLELNDPVAITRKEDVQILIAQVQESIRGPGGPLILVIDDVSAGIVQYKWKTSIFLITDFWVKKDFLPNKYLARIIDLLDRYAVFSGHHSIEIRKIFGKEAASQRKLANFFLNNGYTISEGKIVKHIKKTI